MTRGTNIFFFLPQDNTQQLLCCFFLNQQTNWNQCNEWNFLYALILFVRCCFLLAMNDNDWANKIKSNALVCLPIGMTIWYFRRNTHLAPRTIDEPQYIAIASRISMEDYFCLFSFCSTYRIRSMYWRHQLSLLTVSWTDVMSCGIAAGPSSECGYNYYVSNRLLLFRWLGNGSRNWFNLKYRNYAKSSDNKKKNKWKKVQARKHNAVTCYTQFHFIIGFKLIYYFVLLVYINIKKHVSPVPFVLHIRSLF